MSSFVSLEISIFPNILYHCRVFSLYEGTLVYLFLSDGAFLPFCDHDVDFWHQLSSNVRVQFNNKSKAGYNTIFYGHRTWGTVYRNWICSGDFFFHITYSRWTSSLPSCLWSQRIFPSLPGSRLTIFYRDASSALLQLVNQWLNFTYSRSHAFRYERKNTNPTLVRIELTTSVLADVEFTY